MTVSRFLAVIPVCVGLTAASAADGASTPADRFAAAQSVFDAARELQARGHDDVEVRRRFLEAAMGFEAIARDGVRSVNLFVNTGNAFHFAGNEPRALLWYLRAMRLANTAETRSGVAVLRKACGAEPWPAERGSIRRALLAWHYDLSCAAKQRLLIAVYPLGTILVAWGALRRRRAVRRLGFGLMLLGATMGVSDLVAATGGDRWAVVMEAVKGYAGDGETYTVLRERITPGQEVRLLEQRGQWSRVALPSGPSCWVPSAAVEPY